MNQEEKEELEIKKRIREERDDKIEVLYLSGSTISTIADKLGVFEDEVNQVVKRRFLIKKGHKTPTDIKINDSWKNQIKVKIKEGLWVYYDPKKTTEEELKKKWNEKLDKQSKLI